jgi:hypothetical protein
LWAFAAAFCRLLLLLLLLLPSVWLKKDCRCCCVHCGIQQRLRHTRCFVAFEVDALQRMLHKICAMLHAFAGLAAADVW